MKYLYIIFILFLVSFSGCRKFLDKTDPTATTFQEFFNDEGDLQRVVYSTYRDVFCNPGDRRLIFYMMSGKSDNAYSRLQSDNQQEIANGNYNANTGLFEYYYTLHMKHIGRINRYLANIDVPYVENESVREKYKNILIGLRIWHYFIMTNRWGDIPFILKPVTLEEAKIGTTPKEKVLDTLFTHAKEVAKALPPDQYTVDKYMFNKYSFKALVMRYALYNKRYELAAQLAKEIMDSGHYQLYPDYGALFQYGASSNNNEFIIWLDQSSHDGSATWSFNHLGPHFRTGNGDSYLVPLKSLVDAYWTIDGYSIANSPTHTKLEYEIDPGLDRDPRYYTSIMGNGDNFYGETINIYDPNSTMYYKEERASQSGYWFRKWVDDADAFRNGGNMEFGLLRYAEVLLTYAEAKIMLHDINPLAKQCINQIRSRAGLNMAKADVTLARYDSYTHEQWVKLIRNERRIELAGEGQRYNDIIRWGIADSVLNQPALGDVRVVNGEVKTLFVEDRSFKPYNYLWPFPESTMKVNPNLKQNPGY